VWRWLSALAQVGAITFFLNRVANLVESRVDDWAWRQIDSALGPLGSILLNWVIPAAIATGSAAMVWRLSVRTASSRSAAVITQPNLPLIKVVRRILGKDLAAKGDEDDARELRSALGQIREKARLGSIDVFGGDGLRTINPQDWGELMRVRIAPEFWAHNEIDAFQIIKDNRGTTRNLADDPHTTRYHGIWFDRLQVDATWPP